MYAFLAWLRARETREMAYGLAVGFVLNGVVLIGRAEAATASSAAAEVFRTYPVAGAIGGLTMALIHFVGQAFAEERPSRHKVLKAAVEGLTAVIVAPGAAFYLTSQIARMFPGSESADLLWLAYAIGVFAWRVAPGVIATVQALAQPKYLLNWIATAVRDALNKAFPAGGAGGSS